MPDLARAQMLIAFGRTVAAAMGHTDQGDVAVGRILVPGAFEEGRNTPPVPGLHLLFCGIDIEL
jgi:hypothetical protein